MDDRELFEMGTDMPDRIGNGLSLGWGAIFTAVFLVGAAFGALLHWGLA